MNKQKQIVVMGVGNLLFSDEGIGVHAVRELEKNNYPDNVQIHDGGTFALLSTPMFEGSDILIVIDAVDTKGEPGDIKVYEKEDIMLSRIPVKLSPHQIGIQETLLISELREKCPEEVYFYGVIPASYDSSVELTPIGQKALEKLLVMVDEFIRKQL
jgi:hydrogenase maturation protease